MKRRLDRFIHHRYTDAAVILLIIISIALLVIETMLEDDGNHQLVLIFQIAGDVITGLFIIELSIRWYVCPRTAKFLRTYWVDILAVLPIFRPFRILRVLRLLRIFRMGLLINRRISSVSAVFREGLSEYMIVFFIIVMLILSGAVGIRLIEKNNQEFSTFEASFWWSIMSMIAGEPINGTPNTLAGKLITIVIMLGGLTLFAVFTGVVSAVMVQKLKGGIEMKDIELDELKNHIVICGWNRSASMVIEEFQSDPDFRAKPIVLISEFDKDPQLNYRVINRGLIYIVKDDYTKIEVLQKVRVDQADIAILLPDKSKPRSDQDRDARTVLAALIIEKLNHSIFTCVELLNRDNETHLKLAGVEEVIVGDEYAGNIMAASAKNRGIVTMLNELFTSKYGNQFYKLEVPPEWVGKKCVDFLAWLKEVHEALLLTVETPCENYRCEIIVNPASDYNFKLGDKITVVAHQRFNL